MANRKNSPKKVKDVELEEEIVVEDDDLGELEEEVEETEEVVEEEELTLEERIVNIEKKTNMVLIISTVILMITAVCMILLISNGGINKDTSNESSNNSSENADTASGYDTSDFKEITAEQIKSESKNETIVLLIARQSCGWCVKYAPIITEVAKSNNVTVRYIDLGKIIDFTQSPAVITDKEAFETLQALSGDGEYADYGKKKMGSTPLTLFIKNGKIINAIGGYAEKETVQNVFTSVLGK